MRIANVGEVDWGSGVIFHLEDYLQELERLEASHWDESLDRAYTPGGERFAAHATAVKELRLLGLLRLPVRIVLDQSLQVSEVPIYHTYDPRHGGTFEWIVGHADYDYPHAGQQVHPVLYCLKQWARYTCHELEVRLYQRDMRTLDVKFFSNYSIDHPSRYLQAVARRLEHWAKFDM
jgi:hypothetical protein